MSLEKIKLAISIAASLFQTGKEILGMIQNGDLTDADLQAIIDKENAAQKKAVDELQALLDAGKENQ